MENAADGFDHFAGSRRGVERSVGDPGVSGDLATSTEPGFLHVDSRFSGSPAGRPQKDAQLALLAGSPHSMFVLATKKSAEARA